MTSACTNRFQCRIVSDQFQAYNWSDFTIDNVQYSGKLPLDQADALLALYDPSEELLTFRGPKLWYTMEPSWHHHYHSHPIGKQLVRMLSENERAYYSHRMEAFRIPHPTFRSPLSSPRKAEMRFAAVSCVSNFGGRTWFLKPRFRFRNRFILDPRVELFGKKEGWSKFRNFPCFWRKGAPKNYRGPVDHGKDHFDDAFIQFLSGYKVAICLENALEDFYFTEKFVNAVRAGCIPVYRAHDSVRRRFLEGAVWVDPFDFGNCPRRTLTYALSQDVQTFRATNDRWLNSGTLNETDDKLVMKRLHKIIREKLDGTR